METTARSERCSCVLPPSRLLSRRRQSELSMPSGVSAYTCPTTRRNVRPRSARRRRRGRRRRERARVADRAARPRRPVSPVSQQLGGDERSNEGIQREWIESRAELAGPLRERGRARERGRRRAEHRRAAPPTSTRHLDARGPTLDEWLFRVIQDWTYHSCPSRRGGCSSPPESGTSITGELTLFFFASPSLCLALPRSPP